MSWLLLQRTNWWRQTGPRRARVPRHPFPGPSGALVRARPVRAVQGPPQVARSAPWMGRAGGAPVPVTGGPCRAAVRAGGGPGRGEGARRRRSFLGGEAPDRRRWRQRWTGSRGSTLPSRGRPLAVEAGVRLSRWGAPAKPGRWGPGRDRERWRSGGGGPVTCRSTRQRDAAALALPARGPVVGQDGDGFRSGRGRPWRGRGGHDGREKAGCGRGSRPRRPGRDRLPWRLDIPGESALRPGTTGDFPPVTQGEVVHILHCCKRERGLGGRRGALPPF